MTLSPMEIFSLFYDQKYYIITLKINKNNFNTFLNKNYFKKIIPITTMYSLEHLWQGEYDNALLARLFLTQHINGWTVEMRKRGRLDFCTKPSDIEGL